MIRDPRPQPGRWSVAVAGCWDFVKRTSKRTKRRGTVAGFIAHAGNTKGQPPPERVRRCAFAIVVPFHTVSSGQKGILSYLISWHKFSPSDFAGEFAARERAPRPTRVKSFSCGFSSCHKAMTWLRPFLISGEQLHCAHIAGEGHLAQSRT